MKGVIPPGWEVPERFRQRTGQNAGRQRAMADSGHLLIILHEVPSPAEPDERKARLFWRNAEGTWKSSGLGSGIQALKQHVQQYDDALESMEKSLSQVKRADDCFAALQTLAPLWRSSRGMHVALQQARELGGDDRDVIAERDHAYDLERAAELLHQDAQHRLAHLTARRAEEQSEQAHQMARSAHRLNMLAAVFFPLTAIAALFDMNLRHPLASFDGLWPWLTVVGVSVLFGLILRRAVR